MNREYTFESCRPDHDFLRGPYADHKPFFSFWADNRHRMGDTILNVGLDNNPNGPSWPWVDWFLKKMDYKKVGILEYWEPNVIFHREHFKNQPEIEVVLGDACEATKAITTKYDTVFWWHGPEHIKLDNLPRAFSELKAVTNKCMLFGCPWGNYYSLESDMHPGDKHWYFPENEHFLSLGMNVFNDGGKKSTGSANINAYLFL